jgi:tyrosine-protein kinase Etk/Wzc
LDQLTSTLVTEEKQPSFAQGTTPIAEFERAERQDEVTILDVLLVLVKHKLRIAQFMVSGAILGLLISFCLPNIYTARTTLLPPQQQTSLLSSFIGQLGPISALAGKDAIKNPSDLMVTILQSRTVSDAIIDRFDLSKAYGEKLRTDVREKLAGRVRVSGGKDGVITLLVDDKEPKRAAEIANQYVSELYAINQTLAVTEASQRRKFFELELAKSKDDLALAEGALRRTQEGTGLIKLDDQAKAIIETVGRVKAEISAREVALRAMRTFATDKNPDVLRTGQELEGLRAQLAQLENAPVSGKGNVLVPTGKVPEVGMEYIRKLRELKYREAVYELLLKQYESARIDEAKSPALIQVIDRAVIPEKKSSPKRTLLAIAVAVLGMILAIGWAIFSEWTDRNPALRSKMKYLVRSITTDWKLA